MQLKIDNYLTVIINYINISVYSSFNNFKAIVNTFYLKVNKFRIK